MVERFHKRIDEKARDCYEAPVLIITLGDSVTMGATSLGKFDFEAVYHNQLKKLLEKQYPDTVFSVINAGVGGDTVEGGVLRLERDVIVHNPDLVIIGFGLNDTGAGFTGLEKFRISLSKIVEEIQGKTNADVVLLTPNFMNTSDNANVSDLHRKEGLPIKFAERQNSGVTAKYAEVICSVGQKLNVPVADTYKAWETLAENGMDTNLLLANGLNHPIPEAHCIVPGCAL